MMYKVGYVPGDLNDCTSLDLNYMKVELCFVVLGWNILLISENVMYSLSIYVM